ncbi:hypothetical protein ACWAU3_19225 [Shewanella sp. JL219SE-S6]
MKTSALILTLTLSSFASATHAALTEAQQIMLDDALNAAPPTIRASVTVVDWNKNVLQQGDGSYTCFPTPPQLKGTAPMCMDGPWMEWAHAWMEKNHFKPKR